MEVKRKRFKLDQKEFDLNQTTNANREVDKLIRQLKDEKNLEKAQQIAAQLRQQRSVKVQQVDEANAEVVKLEELHAPSASSRPLAEGDFVRLRAGGATGRIEKIRAKRPIYKWVESR